MAQSTDPFQLSETAKQAMQQQTQQVVDTYFDFLMKTILSSPTGGTEVGEKVKIIAEQNINAAHEYVTKLSQAKDFQDIIRIQTEFMLAQMKAFGEHAKNLGEATAKAAAIAVKNPTS
jgi:hypothetical protein